jgi:hypothetical protein
MPMVTVRRTVIVTGALSGVWPAARDRATKAVALARLQAPPDTSGGVERRRADDVRVGAPGRGQQVVDCAGCASHIEDDRAPDVDRVR